MAGAVRIESALGDLVGEEGAHVLAQRLAFGRQADLVEVQIGAHRDGHQRPEFVGAAPGDVLAELGRPPAFVAEVVAPGQHARA